MKFISAPNFVSHPWMLVSLWYWRWHYGNSPFCYKLWFQIQHCVNVAISSSESTWRPLIKIPRHASPVLVVFEGVHTVSSLSVGFTPSSCPYCQVLPGWSFPPVPYCVKERVDPPLGLVGTSMGKFDIYKKQPSCPINHPINIYHLVLC